MPDPGTVRDWAMMGLGLAGFAFGIFKWGTMQSQRHDEGVEARLEGIQKMVQEAQQKLAVQEAEVTVKLAYIEQALTRLEGSMVGLQRQLSMLVTGAANKMYKMSEDDK